MEAPRRSRLYRVLLCVAGIAGPLLLGLIAIELIVRLTWKPYVFHIALSNYEREPWPFLWRFKPFQDVRIEMPELPEGGMNVKLNSRGFRGPELEDVAAHRVRIVSIGDSMTFGWGLPDFDDHCVVGFVKAYAARHPRADVALAVVAEPGWGTSDYLFAYLAYARRIRPQLVIIGFFCGDDVVPPGTIAAIGEGRPPPKPWSRGSSRLRPATLDYLRWIVRSNPNLTKLVLALGVRPSVDLMRFLRSEPPPMPDMWRETFTLLAALNDQVRHDGGRLVIISYPSLIQVIAHQQLNDDRFDYRHVDQRLAAFCDEQGIVFVPFLSALIADGGRDLFYAKDRHLTPRGQRLCRDVLLDKLSPLLDEIARRAGE